MQFRIVLLIGLLAVVAYLGRDTYAQYTYNPYQLHVCTDQDYAGYGPDGICTESESTVSAHTDQQHEVYLEISHHGFQGTHNVTIQVDRADQGGSWNSAPTWSVTNIPNTTADPTAWIYRPALAVFWPPQWSTYPPHKIPEVQVGTYRLHVNLDGHTFSTYNLVIKS